MKFSLKCAIAALSAVSVALIGCSRMSSGSQAEPLRTVSVGGESPFGNAPAVEIPPDARAMGAFLRAEVAINEGDRDEALKGFAQAVQYDPNNAALRVRLATLYVRDGQLKDALEQCNAALKIDPASNDALLLAAGISSALGDNASAENDYKQAIKVDPKSQEAYLYLGTIYAKRG